MTTTTPDAAAAGEITRYGVLPDGRTVDVARDAGQLATLAVDEMLEFAEMVRDYGRDHLGEHLAGSLGITDQRVMALLIAAAALIPIDASPQDLLAWVTWDCYGQPAGAARINATCPDDGHTHGAYNDYCRHVRANRERRAAGLPPLPIDPACRAARRDRQQAEDRARERSEATPLRRPRSRPTRPGYLDAAAVAALARTPRNTVLTAIRARQLPAEMDGNRWWIAEVDAENYRRQRELVAACTRAA